MPRGQKKGEAKWQKGEKRTYATVVQMFKNAPDMISAVELMGGSDSTVSDVKITAANGGVFYVESKMPDSFAGQFTLTKNGNPSKRSAKGDKFKKAKMITSNIDLLRNEPKAPESQAILRDFMKANYEAKNAPFICVDYGDGQILVPLDEAEEAFDFDLDFREEGKRSGTGKIPDMNKDIVNGILAEMGFPNMTKEKGEDHYGFPDGTFDENTEFPDPIEFTDAKGVKRHFRFCIDEKGHVTVRQQSETKTQTMLVKIHRKDPIPEDKIHEWENMFYDYAENVANGGSSSPSVTTSVTRAADPTESTRRNAARIKAAESAKPAVGSDSEEWVWVDDHIRMGNPVHGYHRRRRASDAPYRG